MLEVQAPNLLDAFRTSLIKDSVGIVEFAESKKYLGMKLYPRQKTLLKIIFLAELDDYDKRVIAEWESEGGEVTMGPRLLDRIEYLRAHKYPHFRTVQLVGGRRSGKGYMTAIAIAYKAYLLTQIENINHEFGIEEAKSIYFSIVADSLEQAQAHQFGDAVNAILECKPLQEQKLIGKVVAQTVSINTPNDLRRVAAYRAAGAKIDKDLASLQIKAFGTNSKTIRGSASIMFVFDEMAHLIAGESRMSDEELFKASIPSLAQFRENGMIFANSSPYTKTGKFFELYEQALAIDPPEDPENGKILYPDHFMLQFPSWEMYKDWEMETPKFRGALIVDPEHDPILAREELSDPDSFKVEYRSQFAEVVDAFLKPEMVDRMFNPTFTFEALGKHLVPTQGAIGYMRYKAHGDPSSVNANFGIAIGHVEDVIREGITQQHVVFDLIDAFYPEDYEDHTIDWLQVVPIITELVNSFRPFEWTFDQFDSTMAIQQLQENLRNMGIGDTNVYSKVATPQTNERRWNNFRAALNLGRVHAPHPDTFSGHARVNSIDLGLNELKRLQIKNGKVDKQTIGSVKTKDIADCIAEVTDALIGDALSSGTHEALSMSPVFGAQGGFFIGKGNTDDFGELSHLYDTRNNGRHIPFIPERGMRRGRRW